MKIKLRFAPFLLSVCVFGLMSGGWAQEKVAPVAVAAKNADLVALEPKLRALVLGARPKARVEVRGNSLTVIYHSARSRSLIPFESDIPEIPDAPTDFSLGLRVGEGFVSYRGENLVRRDVSFGTLLSGRYDLKRLPDVDFARQSEVVPAGHRAYAATNKLIAATDGIPGVSLAYEGRLMTRYEFAVAISRWRGAPQVADTGDARSRELLVALEREFEDEFTFVEGEINTPTGGRANRRWQPRSEYLSLNLAYGKGVDVALVEKIKKVVSDYAVERLKANEGP